MFTKEQLTQLKDLFKEERKHTQQMIVEERKHTQQMIDKSLDEKLQPIRNDINNIVSKNNLKR